MPDPVPPYLAHAWKVVICLSLIVITEGWTVPVGVLVVVAIIGGDLLHRSRRRRLEAVAAADAQRRRAEVLAGPPERQHLTVWDATHSDSAAEAAQFVGDAERDVVIARLGERFASGHLTQPDFDERAGEATTARTRGQLADVLRNLP